MHLFRTKMTSLAPSFHGVWECLNWVLDVKRAPDISSLFYIDMIVQATYKYHSKEKDSFVKDNRTKLEINHIHVDIFYEMAIRIELK